MIITGDSRLKMSNSYVDFKQSCEVLSAKFSKIDRRSRSIANLRKKRFSGVWLPCCRLGVPCTSRIMAVITSNNDRKCKSLIIACSEVKYCLLSTHDNNYVFI